MNKPVVGVIGNSRTIEGRFPIQFTGERNLQSVAAVTGAIPIMVPGLPETASAEDFLSLVDGILLTGARANVHPQRFGATPTPAYEPYDEGRDALALRLIELCVERSVPLFGICRGFQEMNVAFGGTLHPEIRDLPGRMNHRMQRLENGDPHPDAEVLFADRHDVRLKEDGIFAKLLEATQIRVNSLHGQGIDVPGDRIVVEGIAEDETIEAISIADAPGFALGVQWHAEYDPKTNPINNRLFVAFADAIRSYQERRPK